MKVLLVIMLVVGAMTAVRAAEPRSRVANFALARGADGRPAPSAPETVLPITVGLKVRDRAALMSMAQDVSDPSSPRYGRYLDLAAVRELIAPLPHDLGRVTSWLQDPEGLAARDVRVSAGGDSIAASVTAAGVARAFGGARMYPHVHVHSGRVAHRTLQAVAVPAAVADVVDVIVGLSELFQSREEQRMGRMADAREARAGKHSNAPGIGDIAGNETVANVVIEVYCKDGSATHAAPPAAPCSDVAASPDVSSLIVDVAPLSSTSHPFSVRVDVDAAQCEIQSVRASLVCHANVTVAAYSAANFTVQTAYADGSLSDKFEYPAPYRARPMTNPKLVQDRYKVPASIRVGSNKRNSQAIVSFEAQYYSRADLHAFFDMNGIPYLEPTLRGNGGNNESNPGGESTLDVQWVMGIGQGIATTTWSFAVGEYILNWAFAVGNTTDAPLVTSISYGDTEVGYEFATGYGLAYIAAMNDRLAVMATRGLTVIAGSGDAGWTNVGEMGNDISKPDPTCGIMRAFFPSNSPFVTSLSATQFTDPSAAGSAQRTISVRDGRGWTTGGGFSNVTMVQSWQKDAVGAYLKATPAAQLPPSAEWNAGGRGYPDIALVGDNMQSIWKGVVFPLGGTSASGPVAAGLVALLNDARLNKGLPSLGHLNPRLYAWHAKQPAAFADVTTGRNNDGDVQPAGSAYPTFCEHGFPAAPGWDAATGLGGLNMDQILSLALEG